MTNKSSTLTKIVFNILKMLRQAIKGDQINHSLTLSYLLLGRLEKFQTLLQFVSRTPNCTKIISIFFELSTIFETLKTVKDLISSSNNSTYKNLRQNRAQKFNCSETQVSPQVLNKFVSSCSIFFCFCLRQNKKINVK